MSKCAWCSICYYRPFVSIDMNGPLLPFMTISNAAAQSVEPDFRAFCSIFAGSNVGVRTKCAFAAAAPMTAFEIVQQTVVFAYCKKWFRSTDS
jgi:hypothetical protein